jgi:glycylpeptide N-tetradecanoyltransferase
MPPPAEESKPVEPAVEEVDAKLKDKQAEVESEGEDDDDEEPSAAGPAEGASASKKKKKSKKKKVKELLTGKSSDPESELQKAMAGLNPQQLKELLALNPAFAHEVAAASGSANPTAEQTAEQLRKMNLQDIMTGLAASGKNVKDMGAYKFWQTQPVARFTDDASLEEGPIKVQTVDDISKEPAGLVEGFEWVTLDLSSDEEIKEVYELLNQHYVEDDEAMFRFNYSPSFLRW